MLISKELNDAINGQIGREFGASMQYLNIAAYFDGEALPRLASFFYKQAEEEHEHAMKFFKYVVETGGRTRRLRLLDERARRAHRGAGGGGSGEVRAIIPGKVVTVLVAVGAAVEQEQGLLVIEAMKMENEVKAPRAGTVKAVKVGPGQAVEAGELLVVIE